MTDDWKSAKLSIKASQLPWQQVQEKVADLWREVQGMVGDLSSGVGKHYLITQSFESLEFRQLKELPSLADTFSGRVFNKMAEVRWLRTDDKALIWLYHEAANGELECESFDRKYYLWGEWDNKGKTDEHGSYFVEGRMPKSRQYPVVATKEHERAYIMVGNIDQPSLCSRFTTWMNWPSN